jgi:rhodanese-related sulfurtransferase
MACLVVSVSTAEEFPFRANYSEVGTIELDELKSGYDNGKFIIVDIRSKAEFNTIHIKKALNLPFDHAYFGRYLDKIAQKDPDRFIVLYDNGNNSVKAYKAADVAFLSARILNVYAFDAGIAAWADAYPNETIVQGAELKEPDKQLLSEEHFINKNIDFDTFRKKANSSNSVVIDLRDPLEREGKLPGFEKAFAIPIDKLVKNIITKGHMKDKQLYIFDQAGERVKWVMYYLIDHDYENFYFLSGGATPVINEQVHKYSFNN